MIKIFGQTDKLFGSNGDIVVQPLRAIVHKEDNGDYYLELEASLDYIDYFVQGNIVTANTPSGDQAFRIGNVTATRKKVAAKCYHVFYDSANYLIADSYVVDKDCNGALDHLNSATEPQSEFTTISDVTTVNSFRCVRKSLYEAIQTVLERWGGHLVRDNFKIEIRNSVGADNGVTVQYAKNLKEITVEEDWGDVVTKLLPVGRDGILLNAVDPTASIYVVSGTQYPIPYTKTVTFEQEIDEKEYATEEEYKTALVDDLQNQAEMYLALNSVPKVNYTLRANLDKITDIGDTVQVVDQRLGVNILTNVISFDYNCILNKYIEVEFGNFKQTLGNLLSGINETVENAVTETGEVLRVTLGAELEAATDQIWSVLGNSYVIYDGDKILVVDRLPKEAATNVIMINNGGIGFSQTGINGTFNSAWTIDGTLNMQAVNVINLTANLIKGGTLKLGSESNQSGILEVYDEANTLIGRMDKSGLKMYGLDGSYVMMNNDVGFAGYDRNGTKIYWVAADEFHMKKSVVEEEITLCGKVRFIPITITENNVVVNDGIGLVSAIAEA